jgi:hypothetical protein
MDMEAKEQNRTEMQTFRDRTILLKCMKNLMSVDEDMWHAHAVTNLEDENIRKTETPE